MKSNKGRRFPVEPINAVEARAIFAACSPRCPTGIRNKGLLVLLYRGGLRISEALSVLPKDIDSVAGSVRVLRGKNKTSRLVGLDAGAFAVLNVWLERRARLGIGGRAPLFCTLKGAPLKTAYVRALLPRLARRAGIARRIHAHAFRHAFASELVAERTPLNLVQAALGHASIATTDRYIKVLNPKAVVDAMRVREWTL